MTLETLRIQNPSPKLLDLIMKLKKAKEDKKKALIKKTLK